MKTTMKITEPKRESTKELSAHKIKRLLTGLIEYQYFQQWYINHYASLFTIGEIRPELQFDVIVSEIIADTLRPCHAVDVRRIISENNSNFLNPSPAAQIAFQAIENSCPDKDGILICNQFSMKSIKAILKMMCAIRHVEKGISEFKHKYAKETTFERNLGIESPFGVGGADDILFEIMGVDFSKAKVGSVTDDVVSSFYDFIYTCNIFSRDFKDEQLDEFLGVIAVTVLRENANTGVLN